MLVFWQRLWVLFVLVLKICLKIEKMMDSFPWRPNLTVPCRSPRKKSSLSKKKIKVYSWRRKRAPENLMLEPKLRLKELRRGPMGNGIQRVGSRALRTRP